MSLDSQDAEGMEAALRTLEDVPLKGLNLRLQKVVTLFLLLIGLRGWTYFFGHPDITFSVLRGALRHSHFSNSWHAHHTLTHS